MSHFIGIVFGHNYEENLDRYYEGNEVDYEQAYTREEAIETAKEQIASSIEYYEKLIQEGESENKYAPKIKELKNYTDDDYFNYIAEGYIVKGDNLYYTYNPDAKWDWYSDNGGRWGDYLPLLNGENAYQAHANEIDWDEVPTPYCFVDEDGEWHELGEMGWFGISMNEKEKNCWEQEFRDYIDTIKDTDILVTAVDFHI